MLPEYIAKAVPNPKTNRAPWYANTAPAYAGIFLWVGFYQSIAAGAIDRAKVEEDVRFDGVFVLRTNTDRNPLSAMHRYKHLWTVEQTFRTAKHLLTTRPIFHKLDETIRGHVFCSFLALVLKTELHARIAALGHIGSWPEIVADLIAPSARRRLIESRHDAQIDSRNGVWFGTMNGAPMLISWLTS